MTDLSPAAQAAWQKFCGIVEDHGPARLALAAALHATVDQVVPLHACSTTSTRGQTRLGVRTKLLTIVSELEAQAGEVQP
jgi:hypothetical protein